MDNHQLEKTRKRKTKPLEREYIKSFSSILKRDMEVLVFGYAGSPGILFPTRMARFYDYEDWGVIEALKEKIAGGKIQVYCLDSVDEESFYCKSKSPAERILRHNLFEKYILGELVPLIKHRNRNTKIVSAGCSLGAYHAVNIAFRHPHLFKKVIGLSGRYDLTIKLKYCEDLFDGYWDENIYYNMPMQYIHRLTREGIISSLRALEIIFVIGMEDAFLESNIQLSNSLNEKGIANRLQLEEGEAHKAKYWGEFLRRFL